MLGAEKLHGIGDRGPRARSARSPTPTASASTPTSWSRTSGSASGSGWRSSRSSTAAPRSSSSTSRPRCWCRRRSTSCSATCASSRREGLTVLFISHKLDEVLASPTTITVIRRGTTVATVEPADVTAAPAGRAHGRLRAALARDRGVDRHRRGAARGRAAHPADGAVGRALLDDIDLTIHRGEVLGIAGVEGNGQAELVEADHGHAQARRRARSRSAATTSPSWPTRERREAGHRLHPRGPAPARAAARRPAVGEPDPRPPDRARPTARAC